MTTEEKDIQKALGTYDAVQNREDAFQKVLTVMKDPKIPYEVVQLILPAIRELNETWGDMYSAKERSKE